MKAEKYYKSKSLARSKFHHLLKDFKSPFIPLCQRGNQRGLFQKGNQCGFTLIEILIAVIIMILALIPIAGVITKSLGSNVDIEHKDRTVFLAQMKLEQTKIRMIANFGLAYNETAIAFTSPDSAFRYTINAPIGSDIRQVQVTVWYDRNNNGAIDSKEEQAILYTRVAKRGDPG